MSQQLRNEGPPFALQRAGPSRDSDDHVKWRSVPSPEGDVVTVSSVRGKYMHKFK